MAQQGEINQNQNVQGLFTEGSPLNFPAGATTRDENFVLNVDGSRERRLGLGREQGHQYNLNGYIGDTMFVFDWNAVGNDGNLNFAAVITDGRLRVYNKAIEPLSQGYVGELEGFYTLGTKQAAATSINGDLVVVGTSGGEVRIISYNSDTGSLEVNSDYKFIKVRDIWGVDDPLAVDERVSSLSSPHAYNLANQGWKFSQARSVRDVGVTTETVTSIVDDPDGGPGDTTEVQTTIVVDEGGWPSNADLVTYGISETDEDDRFKQKLYSTVPFGTTPAPKGACITKLTQMGSDRESFARDRGYGSYVDIEDYTDGSPSGPKAVASYAGRVFYAGFDDFGESTNSTYPQLTSTIVFSRSVQRQSDIVECYQEADPTTLEGEIVASDGGTLQIAGSGYIHKLVSTGRSLLIFASEGIWELYSTDQLFSATNYQLRKLTDVGCKSPNSVILVENIPMYWTDYGIYALQPDQVSESFVATNITAGTIQSLYDEIDAASTRKAFGFYDKFDKKAHWLYSSDASTAGSTLDFDRELIFDSRLQSWYTNVYPSVQGKTLRAMVSLNAFSEIDVQDNIIVDSGKVLVDSDEVVINGTLPERGKRSYKYIVLDNDQQDVEFYEFNQASFKDYGSHDAEAVMVTGPYTGGDSIRRKTSSYLTMQFRKTETGYQEVNGSIQPVNPSSCIVESRWDWTDLSKAGKFNNPVEMYRHRRHYIPTGLSDEYEDGNTVVTTKSRLRGSGRSIVLKITSSPEKDLSILGYNIQITQNQKV